MTTNYKNAKKSLGELARSINTDDKPAARQTLNDHADALIKDYRLEPLQAQNLSLYVCKLHSRLNINTL